MPAKQKDSFASTKGGCTRVVRWEEGSWQGRDIPLVSNAWIIEGAMLEWKCRCLVRQDSSASQGRSPTKALTIAAASVSRCVSREGSCVLSASMSVFAVIAAPAAAMLSTKLSDAEATLRGRRQGPALNTDRAPEKSALSFLQQLRKR